MLSDVRCQDHVDDHDTDDPVLVLRHLDEDVVIGVEEFFIGRCDVVHFEDGLVVVHDSLFVFHGDEELIVNTRVLEVVQYTSHNQREEV